MGKYLILKCPKCGAIQTTTSKQRLKCKMCAKTTTLNDKSIIRYGEVDNPQEASYIVRKLKEKE
jgi:DNA-directed RNA polymerase subunit M/transcription elongation factor TFIIS